MHFNEMTSVHISVKIFPQRPFLKIIPGVSPNVTKIKLLCYAILIFQIAALLAVYKKRLRCRDCCIFLIYQATWSA